MVEKLKAPFPYFGGKSKAAPMIWSALGDVKNYIEPFCGSAAALLGAPDGTRTETINDADGFVANFWRSIASNPEAVAEAADWPVNENDLFARHSWLVRHREGLVERLHGDPEYYDARIAGWWCWGACAWIGSGWCLGDGPWHHDGETLIKTKGDAGAGVNRKLPHLGDAGKGVNRKLPHLGDAGKGVNRKLPHLGNAGTGVNRIADDQRAFILDMMTALHHRLRRVRVACGDWQRVLTHSVTVKHGLTGVFLDPPYEKGAMDYGVASMGMGISDDVRRWCAENGKDPLLRIVLAGHGGEHDDLINFEGWTTVEWQGLRGYAVNADNRKSETLYLSPGCICESKT